jgi:RNA polymerase sigma-70 factor (ECF subfamily)
VRLALVAAAQILPPRQRAAFFLCDVLDQPGAEAATVPGVSVGALKSLLQRARAR